MNMNGMTLFPSQSGRLRRAAKFLALALSASWCSASFGGQLTLTWSDNSDNEDGFKIERSLGGSAFDEIAVVEANVETFSDNEVIEGLSYTYRVRAFNDFGESGYSNTASGEVEDIVGKPTISNLSDISILEGGESGIISFTLEDSDTDVSELIVSAESSNLSLISNDRITLGGSGSNRNFTLAPFIGVTGSSEITISVFDGSNTTSDSFELVVRSIAAPSISPIADIVLDPSESVAVIDFSIGDNDTSIDDLTIGVESSNIGFVPLESVSLTGSGNNRSLIVELIEGAFGSSTITLTVGDGNLEAVETIELSVKSPPVIVSQPGDTEAIVGDITALSVGVAAFPEPSFQWFFEGDAIIGETGSEILFTQLKKSDEGSYSVLVTNELGSVMSDTVELVVESLITIVQAPVDVTIVGEGTAVLSVSAEGPGLTYQWYRGKSGNRSNPIEGATNSTFETDTVTEDSNYWVEVKTGGIAQGLEVFNSSTIEVNHRLPTRYYFGNVNPNGQGSFGLMVRGDNTAVFLANLSFLDTPIEVMDLVVDEQGNFTYEVDGLAFITGAVTDAAVSGVFSGTDYSFSGPKSVADGATSTISGLYSAVMPNTSDGQVLVIAGPNGKSFVSIGLSGSGESGLGNLNSTGTLSADLNDSFTMALSLDESYASIKGIVLIGDSGYAVDGQREDIESRTQLFNTSIRGQAKGGSATMIAGFVIGGAGSKKLLIRGLGPSLTSRGVSNAIADPVVSLYRLGDSNVIAQNNDWGSSANASEIAASSQLVGATTLDNNSADAAILVELSDGVYTAVVNSATGNEGTALVEVFDVSEAEGVESDTTLANISMRGEIGRGNDVTIAGFVVTGDSPKRLLVRAMGSELESRGVGGALLDPRLKIYKATSDGSSLIGENDDWQEEYDVAVSAASSSGAFSFDEGSKSAAKVIWLDPGVYTAVAESSDASTGVVLVEVYEVR